MTAHIHARGTTPFKDNGHLRPVEVNYNIKLTKNRYVIEHCFGLLKQRFRQLYHLKLRKIETMVHFIRACCVLHNFALNDNFEYTQEHEIRDINDDNRQEENGGLQFRNYVANYILNEIYHTMYKKINCTLRFYHSFF